MLRLFLLLIVTACQISAQNVVNVWPDGKMPGKGAKEPESEVKRKDGFQRITNVSKPTLTLFQAKRADEAAAPAIIVCPGGGLPIGIATKEIEETMKVWTER